MATAEVPMAMATLEVTVLLVAQVEAGQATTRSYKLHLQVQYLGCMPNLQEKSLRAPAARAVVAHPPPLSLLSLTHRT